MLPSRERLRGWDPGSLQTSATAISVAGESIESAVSGIDHACKTLPEIRGWSGQAHDAASEMFGRAHKQTADMSNYADAIAAAFSDAAGSIGDARAALLSKADDIDAGALYVTDQWVVLIKPEQMSAERMASLQQLALSEQATVNELLLAVGAADNSAADAVLAAGKKFGYVADSPNLGGYLLGSTLQPPADDVPDPLTPIGAYQQQLVRAEDMGTTVRDVSEHTDEQYNEITTLTMQDGSKQIITKYDPLSDMSDSKHGLISVEHIDREGNFISETSSWKDIPGYGPVSAATPGTRHTSVEWADGTTLTLSETVDGHRYGAMTTADGAHGVLPPDSALFNHPIPTAVGGALTGLQTHIDRGGGIPMVTEDSLKGVGKAARFGGPAIGIGTTIYDVVTATNAHEACVAGISGTFAVGGGIGGGALGAPTVGGTILGSITFGAVAGYVGEKVGRIVCP